MKKVILLLLSISFISISFAANVHNNTPYPIFVYFQATQYCTQIKGQDSCTYNFSLPPYQWLSKAFKEKIDMVFSIAYKQQSAKFINTKDCVYIYHGDACNAKHHGHYTNKLGHSSHDEICYVWAGC